MIDIGPQAHVLVGHHHEPIAGPDLQRVRDRQAGTGVFLHELAELLAECGGGNLLRVVAVRGLPGALRELHAGTSDRDQQRVASWLAVRLLTARSWTTA